MAFEIKAGAVLIKDDTLLPKSFASEPCVPGWKIVTDSDGYGLDREIEKEGWTFFCIAAEIRASVYGTDKGKMVRRAVERILKSPKLERFNSLEIAEVASMHFAGVWYVTVYTHPRHIQQGVFLFRAKNPASDAAKSGVLKESAGFGMGKTPRSQESASQAKVASVVGA
jgi:hypothetical protein